jgi:hypothetical protein
MDDKPRIRGRFLEPKVVSLALRVALVVGTLLNLINHFDLLLGAPLTRMALVQMALTYVVPYCVSTHGQVFGRRA